MESNEIDARTRLSLPYALCPEATRAIAIEGETSAKTVALLLLTTNLVLDTIKVRTKGDYYNDLDPLVGNFGCQNQASQIMDLVRSQRLADELASIKDRCQAIRLKLLELKSTNKVKTDSITKDVAKLEVSEEMLDLLQCRVLTISKKCLRNEQNYQTREITDLNNLRCLARSKKKYTLKGSHLKEIVRIAQQRLSKCGLLHVRTEANLISSIAGEERATLLRMLDDDHMVEKDEGKHGIKTFGSTYYTNKAVLLRAMEKQEVVVIKRLTKNQCDSTLPIFYRSEIPGGALKRLTVEAIQALDIQSTVLVVEGMYREELGREDIALKIDQYGLYQVILASAAQAPQFVPGRPELDKTDPQAEIELKEQCDRAGACECKIGANPFFEVVHLVCSTMKYEREDVK